MKPKYTASHRRQDLRITLWKEGRPDDFLVARLVAAAFLGVTDETMTVNHINGDYTDNRPENLEWLTLRENIQHGFATGLYDSIMIPVRLKAASEDAIPFRSLSEASRFLGRSVGYLSGRIKRGFTTARSTNGIVYAII